MCSQGIVAVSSVCLGHVWHKVIKTSIMRLTDWANPLQEPFGMDRIIIWSAIDKDKTILYLS